MATFRQIENPMVSCPYNPAHRMLRSRLQMHLTKCAKDHPDADKKTCPYNAKHRISTAEYTHHLVQCPDRGLVELKIAYYSSSEKNKGNTSVPSYNPTYDAPPPSGEAGFWDDEAEIDPYEHRPKKNPLYMDEMILSTMKPAERRKHYQSLGRRNSDEEADEPTENLQPAPGIRRTKLKELRQPKAMPQEMAWSQSQKPENWQNYFATNASSGLGRGFPNPACPNRRIAANIFGQQTPDQAAYTAAMLPPGLLNMGRGRGILGVASNGVGVSDYPPVPPGQVNNMS